MLRYFPPFPSPSPNSMNISPLENAPLVPSPPSLIETSSTSSSSSPSSSNPQSPTSPRSIPGDRPLGRSRSRSAARKCVPPHTRIIKPHSHTGPTPANATTPQSPPSTPPSTNPSPNSMSPTEEMGEKTDNPEDEKPKKGSLRKHHYEDAVRIACGAWGESAVAKKKTVTWEKKVTA